MIFRLFSFILIFSLHTQDIYCQQLFGTNTNSPVQDYPMSTVELPGEKFAFAVTQRNTYQPVGPISGLVFITDSAGSVLHQRTFPSDSLFMFSPRFVFYEDNKLFLISLADTFNYETGWLHITTMDTTLNILNEKAYKLTDSVHYYLSWCYAQLFNGKIYCISNRIKGMNGDWFHSHPVLSVFDLNANLLQQKALDTVLFPLIAGGQDYTIAPQDITIDNDGNIYFPCIAAPVNNGSYSPHIYIIKLDSLLNLKNSPLIDFIDSGNTKPIKHDWVRTIATGNDCILSSAIITPLSSLEERNAILKYKLPVQPTANPLYPQAYSFVPDNTNNTFMKSLGWKNIAQKGNRLFFLGVDKFAFASPLINTLVIAGADTNANIQWTKYISNGFLFTPANMYATSDGGCLVLAYIYDANNPANQYDHYIFRLDGNGNFLSVTDLNANGQKQVQVYPNPATDELHFKLNDRGNYQLNVFDMNGKLIDSKYFNEGQTSLNVSSLPAGLYNYKIIARSGASYSGLWLKK